MVKCSDCENFDEEKYSKEALNGLCIVKNYTKPKNFDIGSCGLFKAKTIKTKDKSIKEKVNIFNLSFPCIYMDTTLDKPIIIDINSLIPFNKKKYALNLKYGLFAEKEKRNKDNLKENKNFKELYIKEANININQMIKIETLEKENERLEVLLRNTTKAYQIISKDYDNFKKGFGCQKIGKLNRIGFRKEYSCKDFAKIDKKFTWNLWCNFCKFKEDKNHQLENEKKILNLIKKEITNYTILLLESNFSKETLNDILFNLMLDGKIYESSPANYLILR